MQQEYIDTSKYQITLHSIDSRFSDLKNDDNSQFRVQAPIVLKNVIRIRLASVEVPLVEPIISAAKGNASFKVKVGASTRYINSGFLTTGNYTAGAIIAAIQNQLQSIHSGFTITLSAISGLVTITNSSLVFTFDFSSPIESVANRPTHWGLGYYLGFRESVQTSLYTDSVAGYSITARSVINVNANPYYLVRMKCPDEIVNLTHRINGGTFVSAFAKVVLTDNYYQLQFDDNSNMLRKEYTFISPVNIPFFQISLLDPWGILVNMMDIDWSYTIEVTEIKNSKEYNKLLMTYQKP
jgi:hypothetical protein